MGDWTTTGIIMVIAGLGFIAVGIPLVTGKIGRNRIYGYRTARTLKDDRVWYPVNALSGIWLIWAGLLALAIGILLLLVRDNNDAAQLVMLIGVPALVICLVAGIYRGWKLAAAIDATIDDLNE